MTAIKLRDLNWIRVTVPISSFAIPYAREFAETYPFPPPATVYGMLLSYIGETDRNRYRGTRIAIAVLGTPEPSIVLRKIRRVKKTDLNHKENSKPDFQTLLSGLHFFVGVCSSSPDADLWAEFARLYNDPKQCLRFGGLSCGESHNLVDELSLVSADDLVDAADIRELYILQENDDGDWALPTWVDHVGSSGTNWIRASFLPSPELSLDTTVRPFSITDQYEQ